MCGHQQKQIQPRIAQILTDEYKILILIREDPWNPWLVFRSIGREHWPITSVIAGNHELLQKHSRCGRVNIN